MVKLSKFHTKIKDLCNFGHLVLKTNEVISTEHIYAINLLYINFRNHSKEKAKGDGSDFITSSRKKQFL